MSGPIGYTRAEFWLVRKLTKAGLLPEWWAIRTIGWFSRRVQQIGYTDYLINGRASSPEEPVGICDFSEDKDCGCTAPCLCEWHPDSDWMLSRDADAAPFETDKLT